MPDDPNTTQNSISTEAPIEPQPQTAQVPVSEPLPPEPVSETIQAEPETIPEPESVETDSTPISSSQSQAEPVVVPKPNLARDLAKDLLSKARFAVQTRKRVKLDRMMTLFAKRTNITNDEVEKFLHVSDATATRYLEILEKENKIKQSGKTGKGVSYTKI